MSAKQARIGTAILFLLFGTVTWLGAANEEVSPAGALQGILQPASAAVCAMAADGNCDSDADCPSGQFCYHDPIALVPYCTSGSGDMTLERAIGLASGESWQ